MTTMPAPLMTPQQHRQRAAFYSRSSLPKAAELARLHSLVAKVLERKNKSRLDLYRLFGMDLPKAGGIQ